MNKKYELVNEDRFGFFQLRALRSFADVNVGDLGGWVSSESNLSHLGDCWIYGNAKVYDSAKVYGNAKVCDNARIYGKAEVCGYAKVCGNAEVYGNAKVCDNAEVYGSVEIGKSSDFIVFKNNLTSGRYYTYTFPNDSWRIGCFYGTTKELELHLETEADGNQRFEYGLAIDYVTKLRRHKEL